MGAGVTAIPAALLLIEALRLDRDSIEAVRRRALEALELGAGGFLLFGGDADTVFRLLAELRDAAGRPLWLAADLERGAGQQFSGCATLPPPAALARHPDPDEAVRTAARITGEEARSLGLNWILAPVLDLDLGGDNPIVGTRSFGADPVLVSRLGRRWIEACQAAGPAACAKHFPGHGRTSADSHLELPVVSAPAEVLQDDLAPFAAVAAVVETVMAAHVAYPALSTASVGPETAGGPPATRDPALLDGLLRRRLGFAGLIVSDALTMRGFATPAEEGSAAVAAIRAGCDLLLYPGDLGETARALHSAAESDAAMTDRIEEAAARSAEVLSRREPTVSAREGDGVAEARRLAQALADETVLPVPADGVPRAGCGRDVAARLSRDRPLRIHVFTDDAARPAVGEPGGAFIEALLEFGWDARLAGPAGEADVAAPAHGDARPCADASDALLVISSPQAFKGRAGLAPDLMRAVIEKMPDAECVLVLGHPRILESLGAAGVCGWSAEPVMQRALARWLAERG